MEIILNVLEKKTVSLLTPERFEVFNILELSAIDSLFFLEIHKNSFELVQNKALCALSSSLEFKVKLSTEMFLLSLQSQ